jgi:glucose-1-phosphate cytidylyltransferase
MIQIGDEPILWHILKYYSTYGFQEFIICSGYKSQDIKNYFASYYLSRSDITFDFTDGGKVITHSNTAEPWKVTIADTGLQTQTGGRIRRVMDYIGDETFMLTYGDGLSDVNLAELLSQHKNSGKMITLTAVQPSGRYGVLDIGPDCGTVTGFREKAQADTGWINAGFMVLEPSVFQYIENDATVFERAPLERVCAEGALGVYKHYGFWQCMDTRLDKEKLERMWQNGDALWKIWE